MIGRETKHVFGLGWGKVPSAEIERIDRVLRGVNSRREPKDGVTFVAKRTGPCGWWQHWFEVRDGGASFCRRTAAEVERAVGAIHADGN
jgi:hypothetical protein